MKKNLENISEGNVVKNRDNGRWLDFYGGIVISTILILALNYTLIQEYGSLTGAYKSFMDQVNKIPPRMYNQF